MKIDGNKVRTLRESRAWPQEQLATASGVALLWARFARKRQKGQAGQVA